MKFLYFSVILFYIAIIIYICLFIKNNYINGKFFLRTSYKYLNDINVKYNCSNSVNIKCMQYKHIIKSKNIYIFESNKIKSKKIISYNTSLNWQLLIIKSIYSHTLILSYRIFSYGFRNVYLSYRGSIHSKCWNITVDGGCKCFILPTDIRFNKSILKTYDKVISITQHWGRAVYHSVVECLPKIGYFIPELLKDNSIKIHLMPSASVNYLKLLGFNDSRIIFGNVFVKRLLVEKGNCAHPPSPIHFYKLRHYLRLKIYSKYKYDIILIKRYGRRDIINFNEVYNLIAKSFKGYKIAIFYPYTLFNDTLNYFKFAKLIVAPHGAGLSNIIVSNKNCKILEFLNFDNICYFTLASWLGLEYYGIFENMTKSKKFYVNITTLINVIKLISI